MNRVTAYLLVLLALPAWSEEGGRADDASWTSVDGKINVQAYCLCDDVHSGAEACAEFDYKTLLDANRGYGPPDEIQFLIYRQSANCTPTVTVYGRAVPTATAGGTQVDHQIQALLGTGTSSFSPALTPLFRTYYATVSADADCADLEVLIVGRWK